MKVFQYTLGIVVVLFFMTTSVGAKEFNGGAGGFFVGTGTPSNIDAADDLARHFDINDENGNFTFGGLGFFQKDSYRIGASFQLQAWGGWNREGYRHYDHDHGHDSAGLAAMTGGLYGTYSFSKGPVLFNVGGVAGAGSIRLGYDFDNNNGNRDQHKSTTALYLEPQVSIGYAPTSWMGVEFVVSTPIYLFDDLTLQVDNRDYTVESEDLLGVTCSVRFTFGKIAAM